MARPEGTVPQWPGGRCSRAVPMSPRAARGARQHQLDSLRSRAGMSARRSLGASMPKPIRPVTAPEARPRARRRQPRNVAAAPHTRCRRHQRRQDTCGELRPEQVRSRRAAPAARSASGGLREKRPRGRRSQTPSCSCRLPRAALRPGAQARDHLAVVHRGLIDDRSAALGYLRSDLGRAVPGPTWAAVRERALYDRDHRSSSQHGASIA